MIDLDKLDQEKDQLLEAETKKSLTNWLNAKRNTELNKFLGEDSFVSLQHHFFSLTIKTQTPIFANKPKTKSSIQGFSSAA